MNPEPSTRHFCVVGAGISGLSLAYFLNQQGQRISLLEAASTTGGLLATHKHHPYQYEQAASTLLLEPSLKNLIDTLNLNAEVIYPKSADLRFIEKNNRLYPLPTRPSQLVYSPLLKLTEKLRIGLEVFLRKSQQPEQSLADFFSRHFGQAFTETFADPFVSGVYSGDISRLSVDACLPQFKRIEQQHGSLIRYLISHPPKRPQMISFRGGLQTLIDAITQNIHAYLKRDCEVIKIYQDQAQKTYLLETTQGLLQADHIILTTPANIAAKLLSALLSTQYQPSEFAQICDSISYPAIATVTLTYPKPNEPIRGLGYLVPSKANKPILGCLFNSSMFPHQCPDEEIMLTVYIGGRRNPWVLQKTHQELIQIAHHQVSRMLKLSQPNWSKVLVWQRGIPQFELGHQHKIQCLKRCLQAHPISLHANWVSQVAVTKLIAQSQHLAKRLLYYQ